MTSFSRTDTSTLGKWWWTVDRWTFACLGLLMAIGFFLTMAASPAVAEHLKLDSFYFVKRHAVYLAGVIGILISVSILSPHNIRRLGVVLYLSCFILLLLTPFLGLEIKGARRWLSLGGFSIQASEFMKPALIILCAWMLAEKKHNASFPGNIMAFGLYVLVVGLLLLQPDMGMIILVTGVVFTLYFLAGLPLYGIALGLGAGIIGIVGAYFTFSHVRQRISRFFDPSSGDKYTDRYQITQSLEAFRNGGFFGRGPGEGTVKTHLPDAHADFIFAVAGEEFGFILCFIIILLFAIIVLRCISRLLRENSLFIVYAVAGLMTQFGLQATINMASTLNLIPTKGMTLPFISYGGSSMLALAITMGMVMALTRRRFDSKTIL